MWQTHVCRSNETWSLLTLVCFWPSFVMLLDWVLLYVHPCSTHPDLALLSDTYIHTNIHTKQSKGQSSSPFNYLSIWDFVGPWLVMLLDWV